MPSKVINETPVIPLVQGGDPDSAVRQTAALQKGGLNVIEVVLRAEGAMDCLEAIAKNAADSYVGAGTVTNKAQAQEAVQRGAEFIVAPGFDEATVDYCLQQDIPVFPGVMTPSEVMKAQNMGLNVVKFFPASLAGGIPMLKALSSVFGGMRFMPTGGVSAGNLKDFLALPSVLACGGSWLTPKDAIEAGDYEVITRLASEAVALARDVRP